ncbi:MAG: acyltransferase [Rikenellaceae bacterium]
MTNIFSISSSEQFQNVALDTFIYQALNVEPYSEYLRLIGVDVHSVKYLEQIPFLPIELFKSHKITSSVVNDVVFTSSGTTSSLQSHHYVKDVSLYEESFEKGFSLFYGRPEECNIYALLPSYLEREGSSLIYMMQKLIEKSYDGDFFLNNYDALIERLRKRDKSKLTFLFGVTFALLDLVEQYDISLGKNVVVMETGGMKGRREEMPRDKLHHILTSGLGVDTIHSEYGMCECLSQSYSDGAGIFTSPPWQKVMIRSLGDPFRYLDSGFRGGINIIDLANYNSCSFIQTQDKGQLMSGGMFTVEGRIDGSDIRGCNLLV